MKDKKTEVITFRTTPEIKQYLEEEAKKQERTPAWIVNKIVTEYVNKQKERKIINIAISHNENINL
jgi:predicted transcriptional regulator